MIAPDVLLGEEVVIGPYAVIESGAVIGDRTVVGPHAVVHGATTLGADCRVHAHAVVGDSPQDLSFDEATPTRVRVGDRTVLREHATVHRATEPGGETVLGEDVLVMGGAHVAHDVVVEDGAILCNSALVAGHCRIGQRAFLSGNVVVHQFCRVGRVVMLSGVSGVNQDIGPFLTVAERSRIVGLNTVGMRRAGLDGSARARVKRAYRALFGASSLEEGRERLRALGASPEVDEILAFYRAPSRGFSRPDGAHPWRQEEGA